MAPEPCCRMCGTTAWLSHNAGPRLTSSMSRSVSGVVASASPRRNAPTVFTRTPGGPTSAAIRSMSRVTAPGSAGSAASLCTTSRRSLIASPLRSTATANPLAARAAVVACPSAPPAPATTATFAWLMEGCDVVAERVGRGADGPLLVGGDKAADARKVHRRDGQPVLVVDDPVEQRAELGLHCAALRADHRAS